MKTRAAFLYLASVLVMSHQLYAQTFLPYPVSTDLEDGSLSVMLHAFFALGAGQTCPDLSWEATVAQDTVHLRAFYDASGVWPWAGCERYDTVVISPLEEGQCILSVDYFVIQGGSGGYDTVAVDPSEVVFFCSTGLPHREDASWSIYPTSFTDHIQLSLESPSNAEALIQLFNAQGQVVTQLRRSILASERIQLPRDLSNGPYWLVINTKGKRSSLQLQRISQE